jgi:hypothetical protein
MIPVNIEDLKVGDIIEERYRRDVIKGVVEKIGAFPDGSGDISNADTWIGVDVRVIKDSRVSGIVSDAVIHIGYDSRHPRYRPDIYKA